MSLHDKNNDLIKTFSQPQTKGNPPKIFSLEFNSCDHVQNWLIIARVHADHLDLPFQSDKYGYIPQGPLTVKVAMYSNDYPVLVNSMQKNFDDYIRKSNQDIQAYLDEILLQAILTSEPN